MAIVANGPAPYPPYGKLIDLIERHRASGLPTPVTIEKITRLTNTPGLAPRIFKALVLLDLVDAEGVPTAQFDDLAKAPTDADFKDRFAAMLRAAYADVFQYIDPATASPEQIEGQFRNYTPRGQLGRMVACFKGLCEYAGITVAVAPKRRKATGVVTVKRKATQTTPRSTHEKPEDPPPARGSQGSDDAKSRYIDLLLARAESEPSDELFDRIEKILGIDGPKTSAPARSRGDDSPGGE